MMNALTSLAATAIILSKTEQSQLVAFAQSPQCDDIIREEARRRLIQSNIRLAFKVAKKHVRKGIDFNDLLVACVEGMLIAMTKFDATKNASFTTYARQWMVAKCQEHVQANAGLVHCGSRASKKLWSGLQKARKVIGDDATPEQLAVHMDLDADEVARCLKYMAARGTSLDAPLSADGGTVATLIGDDAMTQDVRAERTENTELLSNAFAAFADTLKERDRAIFMGRIANELSGADKRCATSFGCTKQRVGQIEKTLRSRMVTFLNNRFGAETVADMVKASF